MKHLNPLGEEKIYKLLIKFSVPAIIGMMVNALYNIVDRIFIGNSSELGANGLAGITISFPIMIIFIALGILFGIGGATLFSMKLGEGLPHESEKALGSSFILLITAGILLMIFGEIFLRPILILFGASETVLPYSLAYMRVILLGCTFQIASMGLNNFIRADGNPKLAMLTMFIGAGINIILDPILIFGFHKGMTGAAIATIFSQCISFIWVVSYFIGSKCQIHLKKEHIRYSSHYTKRIISLGLPGFTLQIANSLLNIFLNKNLYYYGGDIAVSGMGVVNSLQTILIMPIIGLNQGVQPIISFNYGARKYSRVKSAVLLAIIVATGIATLGYIIIRLFPEAIISSFNQSSQLISFGKNALLTWLLFWPGVGFQIIASNFFQAIGRARSSMFLTLSRQAIFLIPAILIFPNYWGMNGLLHAAPFSDCLSLIITTTWFTIGIRSLYNKSKTGYSL